MPGRSTTKATNGDSIEEIDYEDIKVGKGSQSVLEVQSTVSPVYVKRSSRIVMRLNSLKKM